MRRGAEGRGRGWCKKCDNSRRFPSRLLQNREQYVIFGVREVPTPLQRYFCVSGAGL